MTNLEEIDQLFLENRDKYITYADMIEKLSGRKVDLIRSTLKSNNYYQIVKDLKKKMADELNVQGKCFLSEKMDNGLTGYRYPDDVEDPMQNLKTSGKKMRKKQIEKLLKASVGLFPDSWLADILNTTRNLSKDKAFVGFNQNMKLRQLVLIPVLFDAIQNKTILKLNYKPGYDKDIETIYFHPHYLKEYNQRWFLFGESFDMECKPKQFNQLGVDRIEGEVELAEDCGMKFRESTADWEAHFNKIIGVSIEGKKVETIQIEALDEKTYHRILTKPLHDSQVPSWQSDEKSKATRIFTIKVIPNEEMYSLLMSFRNNIRVLGPQKVVDHIKNEIEQLSTIYE